MSSAILQIVGKIVAKAVFNQIKKNLFKPDTSEVDRILGGFDRLQSLIYELDYNDQLRGPMRQIYYWTERTDQIVSDLQRDESEANLAAYHELLRAMRDESVGIRFQTFSLYTTLMGDKPPIGTQGLLAYWAAEEYKNLSNESKTNYHTRDYIDKLDESVAAVAALLHHGLELSFFVATDEVDSERLQAECITRVNTFRDTLWTMHYPPAIRQFKPGGYNDEGTYISSGKYFNFHLESDTTGKNWLTILNYWIREITLHGPGGDSAAKIRAFRFVAPNKPLGPLEMHAYWQDSKGNTRVRFYDDKPAGSSRTYAYTNSTTGKTYTIRFKMIPIAVTDGNTTRRPVKFVPYMEDSGALTRADRKNTWGTQWRVELTNSPQ